MMDVKEIQQHLDVFSLQLKHRKHKDDVRVAGKIVMIVDEVFNGGAMVVLDDFLSRFSVFLSADCFEAYKEHLKEGNFISCKGILSIFVQKVKRASNPHGMVHVYDIYTIEEDTQ